ncbi:hypothetical protein AB205_0165460 [Aquarana catesbeiana]|uniref:ERAP1-like C-terminal domain-containing protein n=1 Tax=Aquarana catesbeiana TaxID=8400 RepID=A0A2G9RCE6_AQUCT|nr:hypothetical protein AB205_0165460 [Aquarana catesbeiana]
MYKMADASITLNPYNSSNAQFFKINYKHSGFFRVNYETQTWQDLAALLVRSHTDLSAGDRAGLIDDVFALASYISLQAMSMSGRPTRRGRQSQANKRGQAGLVSRGNSAGHGHAGRVELQHAEDLVEWMTKPSSSSHPCSGYFVWQSSCQRGLFPRLNGISHSFPSPTMSS